MREIRDFFMWVGYYFFIAENGKYYKKKYDTENDVEISAQEYMTAEVNFDEYVNA